MRFLLLAILAILAVFMFAPVPYLATYIITHLLALVGIVAIAFFIITWYR